jgi:hypothetical protein
MNIIVKPYGSSHCYCRPDTTWERENKDFYSPECVNEIHWTPIVFVRISKAGKCIGAKFVSRYYDAFSFGALLYCHTEGGNNEAAFTSCADHTSLLPSPLFSKETLESEMGAYEVRKNNELIFDSTSAEKSASLKEMLEEAICKASALTSLRIGDFVAVELAPAGILASKDEGSAAFRASYCENDMYDFKLIF